MINYNHLSIEILVFHVLGTFKLSISVPQMGSIGLGFIGPIPCPSIYSLPLSPLSNNFIKKDFFYRHCLE